MKKPRSVFGLLVALLVALDTVYAASTLGSAINSASSGAAALGAAIGSRLIQPYLTMLFLGAAAALIGYFARFKWGYIIAAVLIVAGILQLPAIVGFPSDPVIMVVLLIIAFIVTGRKEKKAANQVEEMQG